MVIGMVMSGRYQLMKNKSLAQRLRFWFVMLAIMAGVTGCGDDAPAAGVGADTVSANTAPAPIETQQASLAQDSGQAALPPLPPLPDGWVMDEQATKAAPWPAGAVTARDETTSMLEPPAQIYRRFYGVDRQGRFVVQDFFTQGNIKRTEPFMLLSVEGVTAMSEVSQLPVDGRFVGWYANGQKRVEGQFANGKAQGVWRAWHNNGELARQGEFRQGQPAGEWRAWSRNGRLVGQTDYDQQP